MKNKILAAVSEGEVRHTLKQIPIPKVHQNMAIKELEERLKINNIVTLSSNSMRHIGSAHWL